MPLPKPCVRCGKRIPNPTRKQTLCDSCLKEVKNVNFIKLLCHRKNIGLADLNRLW